MSKKNVSIYDSTASLENLSQANAKPKKRGKLKAWVKKHKVITSLICLALVGAIAGTGIFIAGRGDSSSTSYAFVRTTTLAKGNLENSISATGSVESAKSSTVTTSLNYKIKTVNVSVGDTVKEGDIICTLDTSELEEQIERERENLESSSTTAQKSYDTALSSYNNAKAELEECESELADAKAEKSSAYTPYSKAKSAVSSYQTAYDNALEAYNTAGATYVKAQSTYNSAVTKYKKGGISASKLVSAAQSYMKAVQNYYGGCTVGSYNISDSDTSTNTSVNTSANSGVSASYTDGSNAVSGNNLSASSGSSLSAVEVGKTANDICAEIVETVKALTGSALGYSSGSNTLLKLSQKASALSEAKQSCNYSSLKSAYETASSLYDSVKQSLEQCESSLEQADTQLEQAKEQLNSATSSDTLEELESQLEECELKAQQDGTVTALNATVGSAPSGMEAVATISDLDSLKVSITISEADINNAEIGMSCYITSDASSDTLNGTLTQLDPTAGEQGSFGAEVTVDDATQELLIGMNASVEILVSSAENVYQVPIDAVGNDDDDLGDYVYRQTGGEDVDMTFEKVYVTTGEQNDYYIEIESEELAEGDVIRSSADLTQGIETGETTQSEESSSLFGSLFSGMGGGMPSGGMPSGDMPSGNMPSSGGSSSGGRGNFQPGGIGS